ncbi:Zn(2)-C6 fungal-type DNA-binding domain protein [Metarhizium album ARSEF 1941]|uniref:Zn(2)-C6 fungal-type DNA-binding domain protein n=1 Tax=Metarhizium album (strain ARSEF 1941) TaxID=1081103 RepID=A0A0B2WN13_METAS|nr:Zn(2)-C6 fungal-type DNA-binding domain protein [Metarhizium album ARSEF 1941]KHN94882.1 Zn(2)-C6 fungal-type DNA-binding domain protein [Metarhizium album ARSEF 1941]
MADPFFLVFICVQNWSTPPDGACVNCRARKVRCGRERPRCGNCRRDGAECAYSSPPKRVNHIKVLCQNFEDIQTRLIVVQEDLAALTSMFKQTNAAPGLKTDPTKEDPPDRDLLSRAAEGDFGDDNAGESVGHIFRDAGTQIEQYHGTWTLVSQCHDFAADVKASMLANGDETVDEAMENHINKLTQDAAVDDSGDFGKAAPDEAVRLPSKQFLSAVLDTFFKLVDYTTDISEPQITYEALERVYREPLGPSSEAWAVYFNLVILVVLGAENPNLIDDPFIRPALQASQVAIKKPSIFLAPKLINVQTLSLVSLLAHHCQNEELGNGLFMQACILAKAMGLDQSVYGLQASGLSQIEATERRKVYESLFIRDQCAAITRGTISWLPSNSSSVSSVNLRHVESRPGSGSPSRYNLARLQGDLLSILTPGALTSQDQRVALSELQNRLTAWSRDVNVPSSTPPSTTEDVSMHLAFLSTRIRLNQALYGHDTNVSHQLLHDSRLCCLLLVVSCCRPLADDYWRRLECLLGGQTSITLPTKRQAPLFTTPSSSTSSSSPSSTPASPLLPAAEPARFLPHAPPGPALSIHKLWASFPPAAVFILARNIMQIRLVPASSGSLRLPTDEQNDTQDGAEAREDVRLLDALRQVTQPADGAANFRLSRSTNQLGTVIQDVVELLTAATQPRANLMDSLTPMSLLLQEPSPLFDMDGLEAYCLQIPETSGLTWPASGAADMASTSESGYSSAASKSIWDKQVEVPQFPDQMAIEGVSWPIKFGDDGAEGAQSTGSGGTRDRLSSRGKKRQRRSASRSSSRGYSPDSRRSS